MEQITTLWFVFRIKDGDVLNCSMATLSRESARQRMLDVAENDIDDDTVWYRLQKYYYPGILNKGQRIHIVVRSDDVNYYALMIESVVDQFALIPAYIQDNEDDYWIEDIEITE